MSETANRIESSIRRALGTSTAKIRCACTSQSTSIYGYVTSHDDRTSCGIVARIVRPGIRVENKVEVIHSPPPKQVRTELSTHNGSADAKSVDVH